MKILRTIYGEDAHGQNFVCETHIDKGNPFIDQVIVEDKADCECCRFLDLVSQHKDN